MKGGGTGKLSLRWAGALLVIVTELVLTAALLLRKDADDVPAFERLERSTGVLDDVEARCNTQPVGGGPATVTFCGLDLVFGGSVGTVTYPYGRLSYSKAHEQKNALLADSRRATRPCRRCPTRVRPSQREPGDGADDRTLRPEGQPRRVRPCPFLGLTAVAFPRRVGNGTRPTTGHCSTVAHIHLTAGVRSVTLRHERTSCDELSHGKGEA